MENPRQGRLLVVDFDFFSTISWKGFRRRTAVIACCTTDGALAPLH